MCEPISSKFLTDSTGEKIVKIGQYLAKIWTKHDSLLIWTTLYYTSIMTFCLSAQCLSTLTYLLTYYTQQNCPEL